jgi:hypothetical protein
LTEEAQLLLLKLAEKGGIDRTAVLETLIRQRAHELGIMAKESKV